MHMYIQILNSYAISLIPILLAYHLKKPTINSMASTHTHQDRMYSANGLQVARPCLAGVTLLPKISRKGNCFSADILVNFCHSH